MLHLIFNPLHAELNLISHLLALLGAHHIFHVSGLRVKQQRAHLINFKNFCCDAEKCIWWTRSLPTEIWRRRLQIPSKLHGVISQKTQTTTPNSARTSNVIQISNNFPWFQELTASKRAILFSLTYEQECTNFLQFYNTHNKRQKLDVHRSVHRNIKFIERTNKMQPCSRIYYSNVS